MAGAPLVTSLPIERPTANGTHFDEPFVEPFLAKHSQWYRRHSKAQQQQQPATATEASPQRNNSVVSSEAVESAAPVPASAAAGGGISSEQHEQGQALDSRAARAEKAARRSSVVKALRWAFWYNGNE